MPPAQQLPPHHASTGLKVWLAIFGLILVITLGYIVWLQNTATEDDTSSYTAPKVTQAEEAPTVVCDDAATGLKNYTSEAQGFCFNYPTAWTLTDEADAANKIAWRVSLTDKVVPNSDYPGQLHVYKYKNLADLNSQGLAATTLKGFLDLSAAAADPTYINIKTATLGGKAAYTADAGPNQLSGGSYYFVELADASIVQVWVVSDNTDTDNIVASFNLTS